ncbi:MAG: holo-ACP synthase [Spirochaetales bacterium]|nr:holo-ACP synthase [Leptospiraceae bacterium]MCP5480457.1 holo-ACP synthase [Spirochaetales bacterium]
MIVGLGTDIIENERIGEVYHRHGRRFLDRIFTEDEIEYAESHEDPVPYLAARFAVKEAAVKALNIGGATGIGWKDVEVAGKIFGKKKLLFHGRAQALALERGVNRMHVSLTHNRGLSMAVVILEQA